MSAPAGFTWQLECFPGESGTGAVGCQQVDVGYTFCDTGGSQYNSTCRIKGIGAYAGIFGNTVHVAQGVAAQFSISSASYTNYAHCAHWCNNTGGIKVGGFFDACGDLVTPIALAAVGAAGCIDQCLTNESACPIYFGYRPYAGAPTDEYICNEGTITTVTNITTGSPPATGTNGPVGTPPDLS